MLSRVADSLYWMSRYIERAEQTSRLVDVNLKQMLDESPEVSGRRWERVVSCLRTDPPKGEKDAAAVATWMMFERTNPDSISTCVAVARENARQIRESLSADFWENINRLHLYVKKVVEDVELRKEPQEFLRQVRHGIHVLHGIEDDVLVRTEGWNFIQADGFLHWVGVLRSCSAFEAYTKTYTAELRPDRVLEFLLLNARFPRSVAFCIQALHDGILAIEAEHGFPRAERAVKLARRLSSLLDFWDSGELMEGDLRARLAEVETFCGQIHSALEDAYMFYPNAPTEIREKAA